MNDTTRTILIALGVALLVVVLVPLLFMTGMMASMTSGGMMSGRGVGVIGILVLLAVVAGVALVAIGANRRR